jgi:hypothetical protein
MILMVLMMTGMALSWMDEGCVRPNSAVRFTYRTITLQ